MVYDNNDGPIYSVLNGKCSGEVQWVWTIDCSSGYWSHNSGSCSAVPGCYAPYPLFDGASEGNFTTTTCRV